MNLQLLLEAFQIFELYGVLAPVHIEDNFLIVASESPKNMAPRDLARLEELGWEWDDVDNNWLFLS